jgi:hypothetical protein
VPLHLPIAMFSRRLKQRAQTVASACSKPSSPLQNAMLKTSYMYAFFFVCCTVPLWSSFFAGEKHIRLFPVRYHPHQIYKNVFYQASLDGAWLTQLSCCNNDSTSQGADQRQSDLRFQAVVRV